MAVRGAKSAETLLLGTEVRPSGFTVTRWRAPNGYYTQVVLPIGHGDEADLAHVRQFVTDNITDRRPHDSRL